MTEYKRLRIAERIAHTVEVVEVDTGKAGVANSCGDGVAVFYGADDGSEDGVISPREFCRRFKVTVAVCG